MCYRENVNQKIQIKKRQQVWKSVTERLEEIDLAVLNSRSS